MQLEGYPHTMVKFPYATAWLRAERLGDRSIAALTSCTFACVLRIFFNVFLCWSCYQFLPKPHSKSVCIRSSVVARYNKRSPKALICVTITDLLFSRKYARTANPRCSLIETIEMRILKYSQRPITTRHTFIHLTQTQLE